MTRKTYAEKLRDPRWQKVRLEVLERAGWKCEACTDEDSELHVHHGYYERDKDPWDYPQESLRALCGECHKLADKTRKDVRNYFGWLHPHDTEKACGFIKTLWIANRRGPDGSYLGGGFIELSFGELPGAAAALGWPYDEILHAWEPTNHMLGIDDDGKPFNPLHGRRPCCLSYREGGST